GAMLVQTEDHGPRIVHFLASVSALVEELAASGHLVDAGSPQTWDWDSIEPVVERWIGTSAGALARVAYNSSTVIEADIVVLDSILPKVISERLAEKLSLELAGLPVRDNVPGVVTGKLGRLAPAIGAAELTLFLR